MYGPLSCLAISLALPQPPVSQAKAKQRNETLVDSEETFETSHGAPALMTRDVSCSQTKLVSYLVSWCFKPSQPQRIISGLRETFIKKYIVERTNKAEEKVRKNRVRKSRVVGRIYEMKYS